MAARFDPLFGALNDDGWFPSPAHILRRAAILESFKGFAPGKLLEMGCGAGRMLVDWHRLGHSGRAVDLDVTARQLAARCVKAFGANFVVADSVDETERASFDYLVATEVLEHLEDPFAALISWSAQLKDEGVLLVTVPAFQSLWGASDKWAGHVQRFEPDAFRRLVEASGFEVLSLRLYGYPIGNMLRVFGNFASGLKMRRRAERGVDRQDATLASGHDRSIENKLAFLLRSVPSIAVLRLAVAMQRQFGRWGRGHGLVLVGRKKAVVSNKRVLPCPA